MAKKPGFTLDQYKHAGATLRRAEYEAGKVLSALYRSYVINSGEGAKVIRQIEPIVQGGLFTARDNLAAIMESEFPGVNISNVYHDMRQPLLRDNDWADVAFPHVAFNKRVHKKTGFTMADHRIAGAILYRVRDELGATLITISRASLYSRALWHGD